MRAGSLQSQEICAIPSCRQLRVPYNDQPPHSPLCRPCRRKRAALVTFITSGDPDAETGAKILAGLPAAGADIIEIGMPFTDPMADGPAIQAAGLRALKDGMTLTKTLHIVKQFREADDKTPIILMGYFNPIYIYGVERFLVNAKAAGIDGLIVVDLPPGRRR